jgi:hypothetical protein
VRRPPTEPEFTDAQFTRYEKDFPSDIRKIAANLLASKRMTSADVVGALVGMSFSKPLAEAAVRIIAVSEPEPEVQDHATTYHLDPSSPAARAAQKLKAESRSGAAPENGPLAKLFMKADRLRPLDESRFCDGVDEYPSRRVFPELVEEAIAAAGVQPTFTLAYPTFPNVYRHENMQGGKIVRTFTAADVANVLEKAATSLMEAAKRIRVAAKVSPKRKVKR